VEVLRPQLKWKSAAQIEYDAAYSLLTQTQKDSFGAWWFSTSTKRTLVISGDKGFSNAAKILNWCRGRSFSDATFNLAVTNLASTLGLHLVRESSFRPSPHTGSDSSFLSKNETNLTARNHARRAAEAAAVISGQKPAPTADYRSAAESVRGRTHSETERLNKMFVMKSGTSEIDWEATNTARRRVAGL